MKYILLSILLGLQPAFAETMTPSSMIEKYEGLLMQISKATPDIYYLLLRGETYEEKVEDREKLNDKDFALAIQETEGRQIYELRARKGALSHMAIDSLNGQTELRKLNLAGNRTIDDEACKKIAAYLPRPVSYTHLTLPTKA